MIRHEFSQYGCFTLPYNDQMIAESDNIVHEYTALRTDRIFEVDMMEEYGRVLHSLENDCESLGYNGILIVYIPDNQQGQCVAKIWGNDTGIRHFAKTAFQNNIQYKKTNTRLCNGN